MNTDLIIQPPSFYVCESCSFLEIKGRDQVDFLQKQTTNDLHQLSEGRVILSVLTNPTARILDVLSIFKSSHLISGHREEWLGIITLPHFGDRTLSFLKSRIFFMDQVSLDDLSKEFLQIEFIGSQLISYFNLMGVDDIPAAGEFRSISIDDIDILLISKMKGIGIGYKAIIAQKNWSQFKQKFMNVGFMELAENDYELIRIEDGIPAGDHELVENFTPLEVNLDHAISMTKGCYTGQEVIARQINYDKVTRKLCGLRFSKSANEKDKIWGDGKVVGEITSYIESPRFGPIGLAILRKPYQLPGTKVIVGNEEAYSDIAEVVELPFGHLK